MPRLETYENYISEHLLYLPPINLCKYYPCHSTLLQFYLFCKLQKYFLFDVPIICHFLASWCFVFVRINTRHVKKNLSVQLVQLIDLRKLSSHHWVHDFVGLDFFHIG